MEKQMSYSNNSKIKDNNEVFYTRVETLEYEVLCHGPCVKEYRMVNKLRKRIINMYIGNFEL